MARVDVTPKPTAGASVTDHYMDGLEAQETKRRLFCCTEGAGGDRADEGGPAVVMDEGFSEEVRASSGVEDGYEWVKSVAGRPESHPHLIVGAVEDDSKDDRRVGQIPGF